MVDVPLGPHVNKPASEENKITMRRGTGYYPQLLPEFPKTLHN